MELQEVTDTTEEVRTTEEPIQKRVITTTTQPLITQPAERDYVVERRTFHPYDIIWYLLSILELLLIFRILLKFVGANPTSLFTSSVYAISDPFALPFAGIISASVTGKSIMEWSSLVAMAVYWVVIWLIIEFLQLIKPIEPQEMERTAFS